MNVRLRSAIVGAAALAIAGGSLVGLAGTAFAAAPGWEPDTLGNEAGSMTLYDASGNVLTGGSDLTHIAAYAVANGAKQDPSITKAQLYFAAPDHTKPDMSTWATGSPATGATVFPNAAAPAPIAGPGFTNPVVTVGTGGNLSAWLGGVTKDTTAGYLNIYQLRIYETSPSVQPPAFWAADILIDPVAGTWSLVYPSVSTTTTTLAVTPTSPQTVGFGNATLTATVTPTTSTGTVTFFDGTTQVGTPQTVAAGSASVTATAPALGTHPYTAVYKPVGGTLIQGSTSTVHNFVVQNPAIATTVALSANPTTAVQFSPVVLTANISAADSTFPAGTVAFFSGTSNVGAGVADATPGEYKLTTSALPVGAPDNITAVFTPTSSAYNGNTSPVVPVTITPSSCPGTPDPSGATCSDPQSIKVTVGAGSLTITTPYTPTNQFVLPAMQLNAAGTLLTSSGQFPKAGDPLIVVHSSLAGNPNWTVSVLGTDLTGATPANVINGDNLGLTGGSLFGAGFPGTVAFTDIPAGAGLAPTAVSTAGLKGNGLPHTFAQSAGGGNGSASMFGTLSLNAPTSTVADTYTGTITFSVA